MPNGNRDFSKWPSDFIESYDKKYSPGKTIYGYVSGATSGTWEEEFTMSSRRGILIYNAKNYAVSLWTIKGGTKEAGTSGYFLRNSSFPGSGNQPINENFVGFNFYKGNNNKWPIVSIAESQTYANVRNYGGAVIVPTTTTTSTTGNTGINNTNPISVTNQPILPYLPSDAASAFLLSSRLNANKNTTNSNGTRNTSNTATSTSTAYPMDSAVRLVVRMPIGYAGVARSISRSPGIIQTWIDEDGKTYTEEFLFRYIPQNIKYDGLASEWVEIPRVENVPFVDWAKWQLMKVSMSFILAQDRVENGGQVVPDGMSTSVDAQIQKLRAMAQRKVPISFSNMDELLTVQLRRGAEIGRGIEFVINDLNITATRRTTDFNSSTPQIPSSISIAQVEMTFTEVPVERVSLVYLPPLDAPALPVPKTGTPFGFTREYARQTDLITGTTRTETIYTDDAATQ